MQFLNPWLALGLLGVSIPIIIHILTRQTAKTVEWGAIQFLRDSIVIRNRRIRLEEALLMAARCLLIALLAMALARPFVPPGANVPWFLILPLGLIAAVALGVAVVLWDMKLWRYLLLFFSVLIVALGISLIVFEKLFNLSRFSSGGRQDIALILDASTSMALDLGGETNFDRAVKEARTILKRSPRGNSFSLILGGPTPSARILTPTSDRDRVLEELDNMQPLEGGMATYDSLTMASLGLAQGSNPSKQIIIISDGQKVGWEADKPARWAFLKDTFENLPSIPRVIVRQMPLPSNFRNVSVASIDFSRDIVGTDRPVKMSVTIENTGTEAVSPRAVELVVGDQKFTNRTLGQLMPGTTETVSFDYHFQNPGAHEVRARIDVEDEIEQDNATSSALNVAGELRVLIVDGNPGGRFFERAGSFAALALAPGIQITEPGADPEDAETKRFLVDPSVIPATELSQVPAFLDYDAVILADVPRLPKDVALGLESFMEQGGGVLVAPGQRASKEFYNQWTGQSGEPLLPAKLSTEIVPNPDAAPVNPSLDTFRHPSVRLIGDRKQSDFESGNLSYYWKLDPDEDSDAVVGARLNNGDPFLVAKPVGLGNLILLGSSLDLRSGNLPSRQAFVPFIHEVVYFLANPGNYDLNLDPKWELALHLAGDRHAFAGHGLKGQYFSKKNQRKPIIERFDPAIQFNWHEGSPAEGVPANDFKVRWTGKIQPPRSGRYSFSADVDDYIQVFIDGRDVLRAEIGARSRSRQVWLDANRMHDIRIDYQEDQGEAFAILYWESDYVSRQIVPPSAFRPLPESDKEEDRDVIASYRVTGPNGEVRLAKISATAGGAVAKIQGDVAAGTYHIHVPEDEREKFGDLLGTGETIPFTVTRDPAESRLQPLSPADEEFLASYVNLVKTDSPEQVIQILSGESFGEELWKYLAVGALIIVLLEIALSRWIASSRRADEDQSIQFETGDAAGANFRKQLARMQRAS